MARKIVIDLKDPVTDALIKSQNKRLKVLESLIRQKKRKKEDASVAMREMNQMKSLIKESEKRIMAIQAKTSSMIDAFKKSNKAPKITIVNSGTRERVVPYPS